MKNRYTRIAGELLLSLLLALTANLLWLAELLNRIGWLGLEWLSRAHYSIFGVILLVVIAYLFPLRSNLLAAKEKSELLLPGIFLYTISLVAFHMAKILLFTIYSRVFAIYGYGLVFGLLLLAPATATAFYYLTNTFILRVRRRQILLLTFAILATVPLSRWTAILLSGFGYGDGQTFVDAVKMGYPFFWIVLMTAIASILTRLFYQKKSPPPEPPSRSDILDDQVF